MCERLAADVDGATARDQQQAQRLSPLPGSRKGERLAGERGPCRAYGVETIECDIEREKIPIPDETFNFIVFIL